MDATTSRMRLVANWETDRAVANAVQRMFSMALTRLIINSFSERQTALVITVKLQGSKRTLRSNDILVAAQNGRADVDLNISFSIQYPHFVKRKNNILQILLQRRKRYKNRPILGYKTLAVGTLNLSEVLQNSLVREIILYDPDMAKDDLQMVNSIGRLMVSSCQSQAFEVENEVFLQRMKEKEIDSYEENDSSSEIQESDNDGELPDSTRSSQKQHMKMQKTRHQKLVRRKNLKQKFSSLLKKFKIPEEENIDSTSQTCNVSPTAQELEELFEELDNLSDSGPEMLMDNLSIVSNPRPGLQPYFATTSCEVMPSIADDKDNSDESYSDEEFSTDIDNLTDVATRLTTVATPKSQQSGLESALSNAQASNLVAEVPTSVTVSSLPMYSPENDGSQFPSIATKDKQTARATSVSDWMSALLRDENLWNPNECLWICNNAELSVSSSFIPSFRVLQCPTSTDCRLLISSIVSRIQKFCNSSSGSPPCTVLGVIGSERLVSWVLRAYVESLQNKATDWINFLRFCLVVPPTCSLGKMLGVQNALSTIFTRPSHDFTSSEIKNIAEKLRTLSEGTLRKLSIGETMLQLHSKAITDERDASQIFIPFISEVRVGQIDEDLEGALAVGRTSDDAQVSFGLPQIGHPSPPTSPHSAKMFDSQDLQIEYWISNNQMGDNVTSYSGSSNARREPQLLKCSIRSAFRSITVCRKPCSNLLFLEFVKEKRRDKVFHKLGMKKVQRSDSESQTSVHYISNVARLICSGKHPLKVLVGGCPWNDVRFFQVSAQWQTHVKHFPICSAPSEI